MYLYQEENDNLKVNFTLFDDKKYNVEIEFNDKNHQSYNNISKNNSCIELSKDVLKNNSLANQPCKINFIVSPQEYNNNPIMEITINPNANSGSSSKSSSGGSSIFKNKTLVIGGIIILALLIILIIVIGLLIYTKNVNKDLNSRIKTTSFKAGGTGATDDDDEGEDKLLS
jgi:ABC-type transport system involved in multi-copper enzyme maturation permease subunit